LYVLEAVEEEECWRQYEALNAGRHSQLTSSRANVVPGCHDHRAELVESKHCDWQAHMDDVDDVKPHIYSGRDGEQSTFWLRRLDAAESADPNR